MSPVTTAKARRAVFQRFFKGITSVRMRAAPKRFQTDQAIALDTSGPLPASCDTGVNVDLSGVVIGGTANGAGNLISGNRSGIVLGSYFSCFPRGGPITPIRVNGLRIEGNQMGVQSDGVTPLPNQIAIDVQAGRNNQIGGLAPVAGNVIAFNSTGVLIESDRSGAAGNVRNEILSNSIYGNRIGIDLDGDGRTANGDGDSDLGANNLQNYPVVSSASVTNGTATITGTLNSTANAQFTLQYFAESSDLASPVQTYLGSSNVTTDRDGNAQFSAAFPIADANASFNMTATSQDGNTSEFSRVPPRLRNISTRAFVGSGDQVTIAGFIASSFSPEIVMRALGPSLKRGYPPVSGALSDPILELHQPRQLSTGGVEDTLIATNDNWQEDSKAADVSAAGLAPSNYLESALSRLVGGTCTMVVRGVGGASGVGLVEVYDVNDPYGELLNISTRAFVGGGDNVLIAGTILEDVPASTRIVARGLGPSLTAAGVTGALTDPTLELHDRQGNLVAANDNWRDGEAAALTAVGLAPTKDNESAIFIRLTPGAYTAILRGKNESSGVGLVELYNLH